MCSSEFCNYVFTRPANSNWTIFCLCGVYSHIPEVTAGHLDLTAHILEFVKCLDGPMNQTLIEMSAEKLSLCAKHHPPVLPVNIPQRVRLD